ncbi:FKBP-type peptidyl-prolyl cis-trans isomerase [Arenimonas sp.]|uniref:FKBP-type peptidyl-prolyl cis-trans isomerase n=1 Tax=Arenimonas sp. TaxID=1872635 RepID=UPI002E372770|nr:FKBP-type peptidyl-prolyl cis-trans isomerase [Arenimonas sp.]HEX4853672.1 FKBP-type peptidyl-prolyl cis-trans isomerase [Arenimonas sp.]
MSLRPRLLALLLCVPGLALAVDPIRPPQPLNAPPKQAIETASGMSYIVLKPAPDANKFFSGEWVEYRADVWSSDGVTRASSRESGPVVATVRRLAAEQPGLARAILSTPVGESRRWWIQPERLLPGYPGMPNLLHVIDLTVVGEKNPVQAPADVAAPPADALRTASGLAYKVLKRGDGGAKPGPRSEIEIHYSGWTTDGRLFDSSVARDQRAFFPLSQLIQGWQEGVQLMSRGDSVRFWIPGHLAYDMQPPSPGTPRGMLVFDVTLYDFTEPTAP